MNTIRYARLDESPKLQEIENSAGLRYREVLGLEWIADAADRPLTAYNFWISSGLGWVHEDERGACVAFLVAELWDEGLHIEELSVLLGAQCQGYGSRLVRHVVGWARQRGLREVTLTTFRDVPFNQPWYERLGFVSLDQPALSERLQARLAEEIAKGFPADRRVAMRLRI